MTLPGPLQALVGHGETVLWEGKPKAPKAVTTYVGTHSLIARGFFILSAIITLIYIINRGWLEAIGLGTNVFILVGGPIAIGFIIRSTGGGTARKAMRKLHYAVTTKRVLIQTSGTPVSYTILPDMPVALIKGRKNQDVVQIAANDDSTFADDLMIRRSVYTSPRSLILPRDEAALAYAAINAVKEKL